MSYDPNLHTHHWIYPAGKPPQGVAPPCPTCGSTAAREEWSTGQCDECFYEDHARHWED